MMFAKGGTLYLPAEDWWLIQRAHIYYTGGGAADDQGSAVGRQSWVVLFCGVLCVYATGI